MSSDLLRSKKFLVAVLSTVIVFYGTMQGWSPEQILTAVSSLLTYILGQGLADFGKEAFKRERDWRYTEDNSDDLPG